MKKNNCYLNYSAWTLFFCRYTFLCRYMLEFLLERTRQTTVGRAGAIRVDSHTSVAMYFC